MALPSRTVSGTQASVRVNDFTPFEILVQAQFIKQQKLRQISSRKKKPAAEMGQVFDFFVSFFVQSAEVIEHKQ